MKVKLTINTEAGWDLSATASDDGVRFEFANNEVLLSYHEAGVLAEFIKSVYPPVYTIRRSATCQENEKT